MKKASGLLVRELSPFAVDFLPSTHPAASGTRLYFLMAVLLLSFTQDTEGSLLTNLRRYAFLFSLDGRSLKDLYLAALIRGKGVTKHAKDSATSLKALQLACDAASTFLLGGQRNVTSMA